MHTAFAYVRTRARDRGRDRAELILPPRSQAASMYCRSALVAIFDFRMHIHIHGRARVHVRTRAFAYMCVLIPADIHIHSAGRRKHCKNPGLDASDALQTRRVDACPVR